MDPSLTSSSIAERFLSAYEALTDSFQRNLRQNLSHTGLEQSQQEKLLKETLSRLISSFKSNQSLIRSFFLSKSLPTFTFPPANKDLLNPSSLTQFLHLSKSVNSLTASLSYNKAQLGSLKEATFRLERLRKDLEASSFAIADSRVQSLSSN
jgi:hypothetical protein